MSLTNENAIIRILLIKQLIIKYLVNRIPFYQFKIVFKPSFLEFIVFQYIIQISFR